MRRTYVVRDGELVEKVAAASGDTLDIHARSDVRFVSRQLPRNWKNHKGDFTANGMPKFHNRTEANEAARRMSGEENVICEYDAL